MCVCCAWPSALFSLRALCGHGRNTLIFGFPKSAWEQEPCAGIAAVFFKSNQITMFPYTSISFFPKADVFILSDLIKKKSRAEPFWGVFIGVLYSAYSVSFNEVRAFSTCGGSESSSTLSLRRAVAPPG